jgi:hypothetical protein
MELSRRDALVALAGAGVAGGAVTGAGLAVDGDGEKGSDPEPTSPVEAVLVATAEALYPSAVTGVESFVRTYAAGRFEARPTYATAVEETTAIIDARARLWENRPYVDLSPDDRAELLRGLGADTADPDPEGTDAERVRFYVVNELLYALYTSPTGGELVGVENPQGHPGGVASYREGP